jgi:CDP-glycerol glycerophosphotransferase
VVVNKDLIEATANISGRKDNIYVANNLINYKDVLEKADASNVQFDDETVSNITLEELNKVLEDKDVKKIITIGRFSPEKGHKRLIKAFKFNLSYGIIYIRVKEKW